MNEFSIYLTLAVVTAIVWLLARRREAARADVPAAVVPVEETLTEAVGVAEMVRSLAETTDDDDAPRQDSPKRVLVVDDNAVNRRVAVAILEKAGYEPVEAVDGQDALDLVARTHFDIVLMDVVMPRMDGLEAAAAIRKNEREGRRIPILALTGQAQAKDVDRCLEAGMDGYVGKPFQVEALIAAVAGWTEPHELAADLETTQAATMDRDDGAGRPDAETAPAVDFRVLDELRQYGDPGDSIVDELVTLFLDGAEKHLGEMRNALQAEDVDHLARVSHTLKGSAGTLGANPLAALCAELESNARQGHLASAESLDDVADEILRVREFFATQLSSSP